MTLAALWLPDIQAYNKKLHSMEANLEMFKKIREEVPYTCESCLSLVYKLAVFPFVIAYSSPCSYIPD